MMKNILDPKQQGSSSITCKSYICQHCGIMVSPADGHDCRTKVTILEKIREFIASLPIDSMGAGALDSGEIYPLRDQVVAELTKEIERIEELNRLAADFCEQYKATQ